MPSARYASVNSSSKRYASAHHSSVPPAACAASAFTRILSSMSVTLRTSVTSNPRYVIHRRSWSYTSAERRWPMCGDDWTVGPHTYMPTSPSRSGTKSRRAPAFVSKSRRVTPTSLEGAGLRRGALGELLAHRRERGAVEQQLDVRNAALADAQQLDAAHRPRGGVGDEVIDDAGAVARAEHLADLVAHQRG